MVLVGWCLAQLFFNALLAAMVAVLPDQVPAAQRGLVAGVLGVCTPIASVSGTFLVKLFTGNQFAMFLAPCAIGGFFILLFASTFHINPRENPDFAWAFASRFMFVLAYAFRVTYQAYYLLGKDRQRQGRGTAADIPWHPDPVRRRRRRFPHRRQAFRPNGSEKIFVLTALVVYGVALFVIAIASNFNGFLVGMAIGGLGSGTYVAVDLALVVDVLPDKNNAAKDLGVFNMAGALPFSIAPGIAPAILAIGSGSYAVLYGMARVCAIVGAVTILPVKRVR